QANVRALLALFDAYQHAVANDDELLVPLDHARAPDSGAWGSLLKNRDVAAANTVDGVADDHDRQRDETVPAVRRHCADEKGQRSEPDDTGRPRMADCP